MENKWLSRFIIGTFVTLYTLVSVISTIHVIDFFELSNPYWLAVTLAIGFELGAAASLASLVILDKMNKTLVWALFITITLMQMQGNMYYAFTNLEDFQSWSELFNLIEEEPLYQKRVLAFVSGAILPLVALGFIKSLVDYIKPVDREDDFTPSESAFDNIEKEETEIPVEEPIEMEIADDFDETDEDLIADFETTLDDGLEDAPFDDSLLDLQDQIMDKPSTTTETISNVMDSTTSSEVAEGWNDLAESIAGGPKAKVEEESNEDDEEDLFQKAMKAKGEDNKKDLLNG